LHGRIDEPDADMVLRVAPPIGRRAVLHTGVAVLVLDGVLVDALGHDALLLGMHHNAGAPVGGRGLQHVAVLVDRDPVELLADEVDEAVLSASAGSGIAGGMAEDGIGIEAMVAAAQRVAQLDVAGCAAAWREAREGEGSSADTFDGDLGALAAVVCDGGFDDTVVEGP